MKFRRHRYPARFPVTLKWAAGETRCSISNINETGARITKIAGIERGAEVTMLLKIGRAKGIVQWISDEHIGIAFRPHIPLNFVDAMRHGVKRANGARTFGHGLREMR